MEEATLTQVRYALATMLDPRSPPGTAKESSDWLQEFRNNNECRARRAKRQAPTLSGAWPTLVTLLTLQGAQPGEQLFAAQGLLYRLRRFDLADALDLEDPAAQLAPPSPSAKPSDAVAIQANNQAMSTCAHLLVAAHAAALATGSHDPNPSSPSPLSPQVQVGENGRSFAPPPLTAVVVAGGVSKPVLEHLALCLGIAALRACTWSFVVDGQGGGQANGNHANHGSGDESSGAHCGDLVACISQAVHAAAAAHEGCPPAAAGRALLASLTCLPEAAAAGQLSIRPRALAASLSELRSERAGAGLLQALNSLEPYTSPAARVACCGEWVSHVGLTPHCLSQLLPFVAQSLDTVTTAAAAANAHGGSPGALAAVEASGGALTAEGRAACKLASSLFEAAVDKGDALSDVATVRVTANGRKKARKQRTGNASDVEQQQLEVLSAHKAAEVAVQASSLACPGLVPPLSRALELAVHCDDGEAVNMLSAAASSCAAAELPQLVRRVARDEAQRGGGGGGGGEATSGDAEAWATLPQLLRLLLSASQQRVDRSACVLTMEPWHRFHDAVIDCAAAAATGAVANPSSPGAFPSAAFGSAMPRWLQEAESALREGVRAVLGTTRYPVGFGPASGTDEDDVEAFSDWRKEVRDWLRGMVISDADPSANQLESGRGPPLAGFGANARLVNWLLEQAAADVTAFISGNNGGQQHHLVAPTSPHSPGSSSSSGGHSSSSSLSGAPVPGEEAWVGCEAALHAVSAVSKATYLAAVADQSGGIDQRIGNLLLCLGSLADPSRNNNNSGGGCGSSSSSPTMHSAVVCSGALAIGSLANWLEKRCVGRPAHLGVPSSGSGRALENSLAILEACRSLLWASLQCSDRDPYNPLRSHDDIHAGATGLLKVAGAGPACLIASSQQHWFHGLFPLHQQLATLKWRRAFPGHTSPPGGLGNHPEQCPPQGVPDDQLPLSASSRRVVFATLLLLAVASPDPAAAATAAQSQGTNGGAAVAAAAAASYPLAGQVVACVCGGLLAGAQCAGLPLSSNQATHDNGSTLHEDAAALAAAGERAVNMGLRVTLDALADLEVGVYLATGQTAASRHASNVVACLLTSSDAMAALQAALKLAMASALLADGQAAASGQGGGGGDAGRLSWGGRDTAAGAAVSVPPDAGIAELSGLVRWVLFRALARCVASFSRCNATGSNGSSGTMHGAVGVELSGETCRPLLELCLACHAADPWADGSGLFPLVTALGGGLSGGFHGSISARGLTEGIIKGGSGKGGNSSNGKGNTNTLLEDAAIQKGVVVLWEFSDWGLGQAAPPTFARLAAAAAASAGADGEDSAHSAVDGGHGESSSSSGGGGPNSPRYAVGAGGRRPHSQLVSLAMDGPALRGGNDLEVLFTLATLSIEHWSIASQVARHVSGGAHHFVSTDPQWLRLVPAAAALLLGDLSGPISGYNAGTAAYPSDPAATAAWAEMARKGRVGFMPHVSNSGGSSSGSGGADGSSTSTSGGSSGGRARSVKKDHAVPLALPGREAECVAKFLTVALGAAPQQTVEACGGAATVCVCVLRGACGAFPSWTLDALTLVLRALAHALAICADPTHTQNAAAAAAANQTNSALELQEDNLDASNINTDSSSGSGSGVSASAAAGQAARLVEAQLLCGAFAASMQDPRFPRANVTDDAKQQFLNFTGQSAAKGDWSGVKSAVKQLCGGKRKTGTGQSLGRPPDHAPWESSFDIRSISCY